MTFGTDPHAPDNLPGKGFENEPGTIKNTRQGGGNDNTPPLEVPDQNQTPKNIPEKD